MNRQRFLTRKPSRPCSYRPKLDHLESRLAPATFSFRPQFSSITLDATLNVGSGDIPITEQGPGSLTTGYNGRQQATLDFNASTIQFLDPGNSMVFGRISGTWKPAIGGGTAEDPGSDPANYGGYFALLGDNWVALRDVVVSLTSDAIPLTPQGGGVYTFDAAHTLNLKQSNLDYWTGFFGIGRTSFTGSSSNSEAADGTLTVQPSGAITISVPVKGSIFVCLDSGCAATTTVDYDGTLGGVQPPPSPIPPAPGVKPTDTPAPVVAPSSGSLGTPARPTAAHSVDDMSAGSPVIVTAVARPAAKTQVTSVVDEMFVDGFVLG